MSDKVRTLSAAIRLGATFRPQCSGEFFADGASCAMGAAMEATGVFAHQLPKRFPELSRTVDNPAYRLPYKGDIYRTITNLNDCHHWTRERIASWLASIGY